MNKPRLFIHALSLGLLLLIAPALAQADSVPATVSYVSGDAYFVNSAGLSQKLTANMQIPAGASITTGGDSAVGLQLVPGATTVLGSDTKMKIASMKYSQAPSGEKSRSVLLDLTQGTVFCSLVKNDGQSNFKISTPKGVAAARGTDWSVTVSGGNVSVATVDGNVVITLPDGHHISVPAGSLGVSSTTTGGVTSYTISGLSDAQKNEIIRAIERAGFTLSSGTVGGGGTFSNAGAGVANPANITTQPTQSPNQ